MDNEFDPNRANEDAPVNDVTNEEAITGRSNDEDDFDDTDDMDEDDIDDVDADDAGTED